MDNSNKFRTAAAVVVFALSGGRICTRTARKYFAARRRSWLDRAAAIQAELDAERARGYGFKYIDGRRIDF